MGKKLVLWLMLAILCSCSGSGDKPTGQEAFFETIAGWDIRHVPIVPPFRATSTYPKQWGIINTNQGGDIQVLAFGVTKNYIYGKIPDIDNKETGRWFLFNTNNQLYSEYDTEVELDATLAKYSLERNPVKPCEEYFQQLSKGDRCYWFPKQGDEYPRYQDTIPDSAVVINVKENGKGVDFDISRSLTKDISKIYYFKILYNREKNDLFYISFDNATPRLIRNNDTVTAYAGEDSLRVSVYTPYSVAESKGIQEQNRIVITKAIQLKE